MTPPDNPADPSNALAAPAFAARVVEWQREHGRHHLPWQRTRDPYRIWLSEIMLQQTQVATVLGYYDRFLARFPDVATLAGASEEEVLALWSGLGYYARARNLHRAAGEVMTRRAGAFPADFASLSELPGVGRSTAGAIAAFASGETRAILDGNVRRVIARHAGIGGDPGIAAVQASLWAEAERRLPRDGIEHYTQGMMDLGARICVQRTPACMLCPVSADCVARLEGRIAELPGKRTRAPARRRSIAMLVVLSQGDVMLQKRPPTGIWGGLWSLPEAEVAVDLPEALANWGIEATGIEPLAPFTHAFTHFTLEVTPWKVHAVAGRRGMAEPGVTWLALGDIAGAALPAPVRKLLQRL